MQGLTYFHPGLPKFGILSLNYKILGFRREGHIWHWGHYILSREYKYGKSR